MFKNFDILVNNHYKEQTFKIKVIMWVVAIIGIGHLVTLGLIVAVLAVVI